MEPTNLDTASRRHPRWVWAAIFALCLLAIVTRFLLSDPSIGRAKQIYREVATGHLSSDNLPQAELDRLGTRASVEALASLLDDCHSTMSERYVQAYAKLPKDVSRLLPSPLDRDKALSAGLNLLRQFGPAATPAVPALLRAYQSNDPKLVKMRRPIVGVLGKIGPPASSAISVILSALSPTNGFHQDYLVETLIGIDPSGDEIARQWKALSLEPSCRDRAPELADWCLAALTPPPPPNVATVEEIKSQRHKALPNRWMALQILGLLRSESERTVPVIIQHLNHENPVLRGQAASSLSMLGAAAVEALPSLRNQFTDDWRAVREAATNAVQAIESSKNQTATVR